MVVSYYNFCCKRTNVRPGERRKKRMSAKEELVNYIANLTPEQIEKVFSHFRQLTSLLEESFQPCHQEQTMQNQ